MLICSSPVSTSSFRLPDPVLSSSSLLAQFATPPFSVLPLPPPDPDELFAFDDPPVLLRGISYLLDNQGERSTSTSISTSISTSTDSLDLRSPRGSQSSESMSASDSLRQSISSTASSSLRSVSQGSLIHPVSLTSLSTKDTENDTSLEIAEDVKWPSRPSQERSSSSLFDRLRPLSRANTLSSQHSRKIRHERRERGSDVSSAASSIKVMIKREQVTTTQRVDRSDVQGWQDLASQTAAWRMMQGDCRAEQVFCDINSILRHAPFATSCVSPTSPSYSHHGSPPSKPVVPRPDTQRNSIAAWEKESKAEMKRKRQSVGSLLTRLRRKGKQGSQAANPGQLQSALLAAPASREALLHASRILGLSWGCAARQVWETDCHNRSWSIPASKSESAAASGGATAKQVEGWTVEPDDGHLLHWTSFYDAYSQGQLDLSVTPRVPKGVPEFDCCPRATPAGPGGLDAPTPEWELLRARAYCRLELDRLEEQTLKLIAGKVASCLMALHVQQSMLHCMEGDTVLRLTAEGLQAEEKRREQSLCAHAILNRNKGMVVQNLESDWRFEKPDKALAYSRVKYYAGMPIVAGNGLPVAVLSVFDGQRDFSVEPTFLKRTAREIGKVFEEHHRKRWEAKICRMTRSVELLQRRFGGEVNAPPWSGVEEDAASAVEGSLGCTATYDYDNLLALTTFSVFVTLEDSNRLQWTLREMASLLDMEMMYIAAVCTTSEEDKDVRQQILLLAQHNLASQTLSLRFHQALFATDSLQGNNEIDKRFYLRQNDCNFVHRASKQAEMQPLLGTNNAPEAMLVLPIAERGTIGFVLGALTRRKTKIIGVEDLRYMEALRPSLCSAIDKYQSAHRIAHLPPVMDTEGSQGALSQFDVDLAESLEMVLT